ncbi:MAG: hypothetical protein ACREBJ_03790, partial [Nitrosotalea sp.]
VKIVKIKYIRGLLLTFCILTGCASSDRPLQVGDKVVVRFGYYADCSGVITGEESSSIIPQRLAGYDVELDCKDRSGTFLFVPEFLELR